MNKNPQIFWTVILLSLVVLIWGFFYFRPDEIVDGVENFKSADNKKAEQLPVGEGQNVENVSLGQNKYTHTILGFSFLYSKGYTISSFGNYFDSVGETILVQKAGGSEGLQFLITPFDEDISLTAKRIKKDLPNLSVIDSKEIQIGQGGNKVQAVVFSSNNNLSTGKSVEGWFVYRKNLYQISGPENSKDLFDTIISTWKLEQ